MPQALPFIGAGLGIVNAIEGASAQGQQNQISEQQLAQIAAQQRLGRLLGRTGAVGNPFSPVYAAAFAEPTADPAQAASQHSLERVGRAGIYGGI